MGFIKKEKISKISAKNMILDMIKYSDYNTLRYKNLSDEMLIQIHTRCTGEEFDIIAERTRIFENPINNYENLSDRGKMITNSGGNVIISRNGVQKSLPTGPTEFIDIPYNGLFIDSYNNFKRAISENNISDFITAVTKGISAIENCLREASEKYNISNPQNPLIDNKQNKISFDDKIDIWIPIISGQKLNKNNKIWSSFLQLRSLRDNKDQHFKGEYAFSYEEICKYMNIYKYGIAGMLFELEKIFDNRISSLIIRAKYFPEIEYK